MGKRTDHIVGLVSGNLQHRDAHRLDDPLDVRDRKQDILGRFETVGLVLGEDLAPEAAPRRIERDTQQIGMFAFLNIAQELCKPEHHRGIHSRPVAHRTPDESVVIFEDQRIGIDQKESLHRGSHYRLSSASHSA